MPNPIHLGDIIKGIISIVTIICGTSLIITQRVMDGNIQGYSAHCEFIGIGLCFVGVVMAFIVITDSSQSAPEASESHAKIERSSANSR